MKIGGLLLDINSINENESKNSSSLWFKVLSSKVY